MLTASRNRVLLGLFLVVFCSNNLYSQSTDILSAKWEGKLNYPDIETFSRDVSSQSGLLFYYDPSLKPKRIISFKSNDISLQDAVTTAFSSFDLGVMVYRDQFLVVVPRKALEQIGIATQSVSSSADLGESDIVLGDYRVPSLADSLVIQGRVVDSESGKVVEDVRIFLQDQKRGALSNENGNFSIVVPKGKQLVFAQKLGFESERVVLEAWGEGDITIEVSEEPYSLQEILVQARANDASIRTLDVGLTELTMSSIKEIPALFGEVDVVKSLNSLPGVSTVGEGASGFNVRGGGIGQNLILLDEGLIFNSSHALGLFSVFNADALEKVSLYKGHVPAQFGGRNSSVLKVEIKDGDYQNYHGNAGIGLFASRLQFEGPILENKLSFNVGARFSYSDWLLGLVDDFDVQNSSAGFNDLTSKISYKLSDKTIFSGSWFQSSDKFTFSDEFGYEWKSRLGNFRWRQIYGDKLTSLFSVGTGSYNSELNEPGGPEAFTLENGVDFVRSKLLVNYNPGPSHKLEFGAEGVMYDMQPEKVSPLGEQSVTLAREVDKDQGIELAAFIEDEIKINDLLGISLGVRYSQFTQTGPGTVYLYEEGGPLELNTTTDSILFQSGDELQTYSGFEPRVSFRWLLNEESSIKLSYNRMRQYMQLISNTTAATPVDFWQTTTRYISPTVADNYSFGFYKSFAQNMWETSLEGYYRSGDNVVSYKEVPDLLLNDQLETELASAESRAYGAELSIKKVRGKLTGWLAYTYARTELRTLGEFPAEVINQGDWFPANFDKPHQLNLQMALKANIRNTISFNFTYESGRPVTAPVGNYIIGEQPIPQYSLRNAFRIPDYHRLDVSWTMNNGIIKRRKYKSSFTFAIYNLYARRNPFSIFFRRENGIPNAFRLSVIGTMVPSVTYNISF
ncbi:MAG: TonB-dependent receptor [Bacteroidota bacterium]